MASRPTRRLPLSTSESRGAFFTYAVNNTSGRRAMTAAVLLQWPLHFVLIDGFNRPVLLDDELDVVLEVVVVVVDDAEAVGEDPHLHGAVGAAGEDVIGRAHLDLHDARAEVPEQRLAGVLVGEGVEGALRGQTPDLTGKQRRDPVKDKSPVKKTFCSSTTVLWWFTQLKNIKETCATMTHVDG